MKVSANVVNDWQTIVDRLDSISNLDFLKVSLVFCHSLDDEASGKITVQVFTTIIISMSSLAVWS